jgi:hypothetical protein
MEFGKRFTDRSFTNILRGYLSLPKIDWSRNFSSLRELLSN